METRDTENRLVEKKLTDISLVAYLVSQSFKIKKIDRHRDKSIFYFDETPALEEETLKYFNHEAKADPLTFSETLRNLRSYAKQG
jgi:hypothetical protein